MFEQTVDSNQKTENGGEPRPLPPTNSPHGGENPRTYPLMGGTAGGRTAHPKVKLMHTAWFPFIGGLIALVIYLCVAWAVLPSNAVWSPDEGAKLLQLKSLRWENGKLAYDIPYIGADIDPAYKFALHDRSRGGGSYVLHNSGDALYLKRLPLFPLVVLPFFRWLGFYGLYLLPALAGAACGILAMYLIERRERKLRMWLLIAFGSPMFIYSVLFWEHTLATALSLAAACLALHLAPIEQLKPSRAVLGWLAVGVMLGFSAYLRQETIIFAGAFLFAYWLIVREGRWGAIWAGAALFLVMLPYFPLHSALFAGQAMPDNASHVFYPGHDLEKLGWLALKDLLLGTYEANIDPGWFSWPWAIAAVAAIILSFVPKFIPIEKSIIDTLRLLSLAITGVFGARFLFHGTFYHVARGLLFTAPWALLGICRAGEVWQQGSRKARIIILCTLVGLIGYGIEVLGFRVGGAHGGLEWGARFVITFYPLLAIIAVWDLGALRRDIDTLVVVAALVFLGFGFQLRGLWVLHTDKNISVTLNQAITASPLQYVVSDFWWQPMDAAPLYPQKATFVTETPEKLIAWVDVVREKQTDQFLMVSANEALLIIASQNQERFKLHPLESQHIGSVTLFRVGIEPK